MKRLRHDLNYLTSAGLLVAAAATAVTGVVADLWDLNDFWYHTLAGYVMGGLAILHVLLNWHSLVGYARFRLVRRSPAVRAQPAVSAQPSARAQPGVRGQPIATEGGISTRAAGAAPAATREVRPARGLGGWLVSRRGLMGGALGAAGGWVFGRGLRPPPQIPAGSDVGVVYHQWSKPGVIDVLGSVTNWGQQPPLYKEMPGIPRRTLPPPSLDGGLSTEEAIVRRRSVRAYSGAPMELVELSRVLHLATGIVADEWANPHRTAPSSGALYPLELYPVVHNVTGLEPGAYHYAFREHALELVRAGDLREAVVQQGLMQEYLGECNAVIFVTMIMQRMRFKYQDRSYRYGLLEAGHIGQNLYLAATSMGLGACGIGAFMDDEINHMIGVDGVEEAAVYMLAVGKPE